MTIFFPTKNCTTQHISLRTVQDGTVLLILKTGMLTHLHDDDDDDDHSEELLHTDIFPSSTDIMRGLHSIVQ